MIQSCFLVNLSVSCTVTSASIMATKHSLANISDFTKSKFTKSQSKYNKYMIVFK